MAAGGNDEQTRMICDLRSTSITLIGEINALVAQVTTEISSDVNTASFHSAQAFLEQTLSSVKGIKGGGQDVCVYTPRTSESNNKLNRRQISRRGDGDGGDSSGCATQRAIANKQPLKAILENVYKLNIEGKSKREIKSCVYLVDSSLLVLADGANDVLEVFNLNAKKQYQVPAQGCPSVCLLQQDKIVVVYAQRSQFDILRVIEQRSILEESYPTSKTYHNIVKLNDENFVAVYINPPYSQGFDILGLCGQAIRSMDLSNKIAAPMKSVKILANCINVCDGITLYELTSFHGEIGCKPHKVPMIPEPQDVALCPDGSVIVCDSRQQSLSLLDVNYKWIKQLWLAQPGYLDPNERLTSLQLHEDVCICTTSNGVILKFKLAFSLTAADLTGKHNLMYQI